jgi:hypothetical protein
MTPPTLFRQIRFGTVKREGEEKMVDRLVIIGTTFRDEQAVTLECETDRLEPGTYVHKDDVVEFITEYAKTFTDLHPHDQTTVHNAAAQCAEALRLILA